MKMSTVISVNGRRVYLKLWSGGPYRDGYAVVYTSKRFDPRRGSRWSKGHIYRKDGKEWGYRLPMSEKTHWANNGHRWTRSEAIAALLSHVQLNKRAAATRRANAKCTCREPKRHLDCQYCGFGWWGEVVCGVCHEQGIYGRVIRGTERRTCKQHKHTATTETAR